MPKAFVPLAGRPLLVARARGDRGVRRVIARVVPVIARGRSRALGALAARARRRSRSSRRRSPAAPSGRTRCARGSRRSPADVEWVAVHDAARPFVRPAAVARVVEAARAQRRRDPRGAGRRHHQAGAGRARVETPPRAECWAAQTPQVFRVELLREALAKASALRARRAPTTPSSSSGSASRSPWSRATRQLEDHAARGSRGGGAAADARRAAAGGVQP